MNKVISLAIISILILSYAAIAAENQPLKNLGTGLNNVVYGPTETPDSINQTNTKGTNFTDCTDKSKDDVGRGIVRVVGGLYQILTFWYPKD